MPQTETKAKAKIDTGSKNFEPKILAFLCNWCSYAGADLAGTNRLKYPSNIRIIRVPCSARMDPLLVVKTLEQGYDGVLFSGCHPGDCHYSEGNYFARRRFRIFRKLLETIGIDLRRFHVSWVSAAEDKKWGQVVTNVIEEVRKAGPNNLFKKTVAQKQKVEK